MGYTPPHPSLLKDGYRPKHYRKGNSGSGMPFATVFLFLFMLLCFRTCHAENRMQDEHTLIIDSYTSVKKDVLYYYMASAWPGLKDPVTVIIDGNALSELTGFKMCNGQSGDNYYPWHVSDVSFIPKPGTHVKIIANGDYGFCVHGLKRTNIDGDNDRDYGIMGWRYSSLSGNFGFEVANMKARGQVFSLSSLPDGVIIMHNFEAKHGFCGVKVNGYYQTRVGFYSSNFYIRDTIDGEGYYIGSTQSVPVTHFYGIIENGIIARTAAEGVQLQHNDGMILQYVNIFATGTAWIRAFQQYQDTGIQWNNAKGYNIIRDVVLDGYRAIGLNCFTGDGTLANNTVSNMLITGGKGLPVSFHQSCNTGATWRFEKMQVDPSDGMYYTDTAIPTKQGPISNSGTDQVFMNEWTYDVSEPPVYVNSGFKSSDIQQWSQYYNSYLKGGSANVSTVWRAGQIVIDVTDGLYTFHRCIMTHTAITSLSPRNNLLYFVPVKWEGLDYPPDDLRLVNHNRIGVKYKL